MKKDYIPKVITLLAGLVVCLTCIIKKLNTTFSLAVLLGTLVVFYIIGNIVKFVFTKVENSNFFKKSSKKEPDTADTPESPKSAGSGEAAGGSVGTGESGADAS